jgi:lipid-A-disaccharide synthase
VRVFLLAGEPSGDRLGGLLLRGLRALDPGLEVAGVGGLMMEAEGLRSVFPMSDLSVMGLAEVLPRLPNLLRLLAEAEAAALAFAPDVVVTIDSPDFCLRLARRLRARRPGQRVVHYVAPTVWAWRSGRARKMARDVDQVLCLFPFEPPLMEAAGMDADFVGHPVAAEPVASHDEARAFRRTFGLDNAPVLLALPGSRSSEVERLAGRFGEAIGLVAAQRPDLKVVLPAAEPVHSLVTDAVASWPVRPLILTPRADPLAQATKRAAFRAADVALAASGTVSLELAAAGTPMVIAYDMSWLTWQVMSRMVRLDTATLVNIVSGTRAVPEFLGPRCEPGPIAEALLATLADPGRQQEAMRLTMERLRVPGPPGLAAAHAVIRRA